eukprot:CAMPEP_0176164130 /NCGR_PEP_ID=MMETSP0120_2-20121206/83964_1 /TAXON_ID=160619 /ORGANISM="Kryptoperidinium foliaceum, Strain CCMP 1326" /LENGTH=107 /DNA_ID=CAMNT_0017501661 /DNA_START=38 /DNA_END=361 /DNA_ORIENTATION=+
MGGSLSACRDAEGSCSPCTNGADEDRSLPMEVVTQRTLQNEKIDAWAPLSVKAGEPENNLLFRSCTSTCEDPPEVVALPEGVVADLPEGGSIFDAPVTEGGIAWRGQ